MNPYLNPVPVPTNPFNLDPNNYSNPSVILALLNLETSKTNLSKAKIELKKTKIELKNSKVLLELELEKQRSRHEHGDGPGMEKGKEECPFIHYDFSTTKDPSFGPCPFPSTETSPDTNANTKANTNIDTNPNVKSDTGSARFFSKKYVIHGGCWEEGWIWGWE